MFDLVLKGGRVIDPSQGIDEGMDVAFADGKVAANRQRSRGRQRRATSPGKIVAPGLIDLHTHVYWGGTSLGVDPEPMRKASGVTTLIDAGAPGRATSTASAAT